jgi:hypothetical protein
MEALFACSSGASGGRIVIGMGFSNVAAVASAELTRD